MVRIAEIFTLLLLIFLNTVKAQDTVELIEGKTIVPVTSGAVRLVSQEVRINEHANVRAKFKLENLSDAGITIKAGFPIRPGEERKQNLKVWIEGKPVKVAVRVAAGRNELVLKDEQSGVHFNFLTWDISFSKREQKQVAIEYQCQWASDPQTYPEQIFIYIAKTGSLWQDKINESDFYMTLPEDIVKTLADRQSRYRLDIQPKGYKYQGNSIEWHFKNWEPTENITVEVTAESSVEQSLLQITQYFKDKTYDGDKKRYTSADIEYMTVWGDRILLNSENERRLFAKALRNEIFARHGRIFTTPEMKQIFESSPWYKPRQDFKETELNEIEKKNIEFIFDYEKKMGWK